MQHDTRQDTQKTAGELQGAPDGDEHTEDRTEQATAASEHTAGGGEERRGGQAEGREARKTGERRMASRLGSGGGGTEEDHGSRQGAGREQADREKKRYINI